MQGAMQTLLGNANFLVTRLHYSSRISTDRGKTVIMVINSVRKMIYNISQQDAFQNKVDTGRDHCWFLHRRQTKEHGERKSELPLCHIWSCGRCWRRKTGSPASLCLSRISIVQSSNMVRFVGCVYPFSSRGLGEYISVSWTSTLT